MIQPSPHFARARARARSARLALLFALALPLSRPTDASAAAVAPRPPGGAAAPQYEYLSPAPGEGLVSLRNGIVARAAAAIDPATVGANAFVVTGSASGPHAGDTALSDDGATLVFTPAQPFTTGETVTVRMDATVATRTGETLPARTWSFTVSATDPAALHATLPAEVLDDAVAARALASGSDAAPPDAGPAPPVPTDPTAPMYRLPPTYPMVSLVLADDPPPGDVFVAPFEADVSDSGHLVIVDNAGRPLFYRRLVSNAIDFKRLDDGRLVYFTSYGGPPRWYVLDASYAMVDSFAMGNGYVTDSHDFELLPDGHVLMLANDPEIIDMSRVVAGGNPRATVIGLVIQELDRARHVVFQWRSWDHFAITDCTSPLVNLHGTNIDYVHANSLQALPDHALLVSSRHLCELTKIDRRTGDIVWRMGPHATHNDFTFQNDPRGFSHQHDARLTPDGRLTLFDNGNFLNPQYSRAVEYQLDEHTNHGRSDPPMSDSARVHSHRDGLTAKLVWQYRNTPDAYGSFMGDVQQLPGGGTMIGWGGTQSGPRLTELRPDGSKDFEMTMNFGRWTYRAYRFPWRTTRIAAPESLDFGVVEPYGTAERTFAVCNGSATPVTIDDAYVSDGAFALVTTLPVTLAPGESRTFVARYTPGASGDDEATLYLKSLTRNELIAQTVELRGAAGAAAAAFEPLAAIGPASQFRLSVPVPNPMHAATRLAFDVPRAGKVTLDVFDVHGRRIARLVRGVLQAGHYETTWKPRRRVAGAYFCRLRSGGRVAIEKLVVLG